MIMIATTIRLKCNTHRLNVKKYVYYFVRTGNFNKNCQFHCESRSLFTVKFIHLTHFFFKKINRLLFLFYRNWTLQEIALRQFHQHHWMVQRRWNQSHLPITALVRLLFLIIFFSHFPIKFIGIDFNTNFPITGIIRSEAFASQPTLERIDLRHNRISVVESSAFAGISAPKDIYLAGNRLIQLNSDVFQVIQSWVIFFFHYEINRNRI